MKIIAAVGLSLAAALSLAATAGGQPAPASKPAPRAGVSCFWVRDVDGFSAPDNQTLYVRVGVKQVYKLTLFGNCMDISWVHHVGLVTPRGLDNICEGTNPALDVVDRELGVGRERCPVTEVRKLTPDQVAALPKGQRP